MPEIHGTWLEWCEEASEAIEASVRLKSLCQLGWRSCLLASNVWCLPLLDFSLKKGVQWLDILFLSNRNIHKSLPHLCFWASDPQIDRFYYNLTIKGSEAQKQRPHELLSILFSIEISKAQNCDFYVCVISHNHSVITWSIFGIC